MAVRGSLDRLKTLIRRFVGDREGVGAIEFAILFPIMVMLYVGAVEITVGLSASKRAARAAGTIADVVTQQKSVTKSWLDDMPAVANAIFVPYATTGMTIKITGITIDAGGNATVLWSWAQDKSRPYAVNSAVTVPADIKKASSFLVRTELSYPYQLFMFTPSLGQNASIIRLNRSYFYRQRQDENVPCSDC